MYIDKNYKGLKKVLGIYKIEDDIITDGELEIVLPKPLAITGRVMAKHGIIINCPTFAANQDLVSKDGAIFATGHIMGVTGMVSANIIRVSGSIITLGAINAKHFIEVGGAIRCNNLTTGHGIYAGEDVTVKTYIDCGTRIFAGMAPSEVDATCNKTVQCAELRNGTVGYGRLLLSAPRF